MSRPPTDEPQRVVVVSGPTAAGKTGLGIALAERFSGEIVNADSMQVYRYLDIGTAKPSPAERARVPHHLIDVVTPDVQYTAGRFAHDAARALEGIAERGRNAFLVGGTGLYIRALLEGLSVGPARDAELRRQLEAEADRAEREGEPGRLHARLAELDPVTAARLHPNDRVRVIRALEIQAVTGEAPSRLRRERRPAPRYRVLYLAIDPGPQALAARIDRRCEEMVAGGLLQEVRRLRERGYGPELPCMRAIGYRHMQAVIDGLDTLANVLVAMKHDTRQFARRQRTWLRRVPDVSWWDPAKEAAIAERVGAFLAEAPTPAAAQ